MAVDARIFLRKPETGESLQTYRKKDESSLQKLFYPGSIAVFRRIGYTREAGAGTVFTICCIIGLRASSTRSTIKAKTVQGVPAVSSIGEIKEPVDAAIIPGSGGSNRAGFRGVLLGRESK